MHKVNNEDDENDFGDLLKLQEIFLIKEIRKQLEERQMNEHGLAEKIISICKQVQSQEDFITGLEKEGVSVSKHFLASLYIKIKQNLPSQIQFHEEDFDQDKE